MKRRYEEKPSAKCQNVKKNGRYSREEKLNRNPSPSASDDSGEENSEIASEEEAEAQNEKEDVMAYKEPTMYDSLLESLRTKRGEYNTDLEESGDDVEEAHGASDDGNEGKALRTSWNLHFTLRCCGSYSLMFSLSETKLLPDALVIESYCWMFHVLYLLLYSIVFEFL
ncbi:uncharacterized protein LOC132634324 [Lycium barbarum]|uniref:uncharacterized protein LOC132634324 n=1 Tax=Lycium barbarum TaxID=112863 RepID=UPI00293EA413|nr:uncharacterized protein LOC132634324 [Lycium barbarum]